MEERDMKFMKSFEVDNINGFFYVDYKSEYKRSGNGTKARYLRQNNTSEGAKFVCL